MLERVLPLLSGRDLDFAKSLVEQHRSRGLSDKQAGWVTRLIDRAMMPPKATAEIGAAFKGVIELLDRAATRLKHPELLVSVLGQDLRLWIAGPNAKVPGSITLTSVERNAEEPRDWLGRETRE